MKRALVAVIVLIAVSSPAWAVPSYLQTYLGLHPGSTATCTQCHVNSTGGAPYTAYGTLIKNRAGNVTVAQAIQTADGTLPPPPPPVVCVVPQILSGGVCVNPPPPPPPPPTCVAPQVLINGACAVPPPPPVTPPGPGPQANAPADISACGGGWPFSGRGIANNRYAAEEKWITPTTVANMTLTASATVAGSVLATPTVQGRYAYVGDKGGGIQKIDITTGKAAWTVKAPDLFGLPNAIGRSAPALCNGMAIVGGWTLDPKPTNAAYLAALDQRTGAVRWKTRLDADPGAAIMQSAIVSGGTIYVGVGGVVAEIAQFVGGAGQVAPSFRGSVQAVNLADGKVLWKTMTVAPGTSGGGTWSDTLALDPVTSMLYAGVGNSFTIPAAQMRCILGMGGADTGTMCDSVTAPSYNDSILALDAKTGTPRWFKRDISHDAYGCGPNCAAAGGPPDADMLGMTTYEATINGARVSVVASGMKNGGVVAINRATGDPLWVTALGPGSPLGGVERALATDGVAIYAPSMNFAGATVSLIDGTTTTAGFWTKLDAATGAIIWQVANPSGYKALSPMTLTASGVVFGGSQDPDGMIYALDASNGHVLKAFKSGASNGGGVAINAGRMVLGTGYNGLNGIVNLGGEGNQVQVYTVPGAPAIATGGGGRSSD